MSLGGCWVGLLLVVASSSLAAEALALWVEEADLVVSYRTDIEGGQHIVGCGI